MKRVKMSARDHAKCARTFLPFKGFVMIRFNISCTYGSFLPTILRKTKPFSPEARILDLELGCLAGYLTLRTLPRANKKQIILFKGTKNTFILHGAVIILFIHSCVDYYLNVRYL